MGVMGIVDDIGGGKSCGCKRGGLEEERLQISKNGRENIAENSEDAMEGAIDAGEKREEQEDEGQLDGEKHSFRRRQETSLKRMQKHRQKV